MGINNFYFCRYRIRAAYGWIDGQWGGACGVRQLK